MADPRYWVPTFDPTQKIGRGPREGYGPGSYVGRTVLGKSSASGLTGEIVGQSGPWIDVRWSDGVATFSDSRLFSELHGPVKDASS